MNSKAQGLPLSTIVIAGMVLVVMVVLIAIFTGGIGHFGPDIKSASEQKCTGEGYTVRSESAGCLQGETQSFGNFGSSVGSGQICCRNSLQKCEEDGITDRFCVASESNCQAASSSATVIYGTTCEIDGELCCKFR